MFKNFDEGANAEFDIVLGDPFLRNAYTVYDFGDFVGDSGKVGQPYMQLLAETDPSEAAQEFVDARKKTLEAIGNPELDLAELLGPTDNTPSSEGVGDDTSGGKSNKSFASLSDDDESTLERFMDGEFGGVKKYIWAALALLSVNIIIGLVLTFIGCYMCISRRGKRGQSSNVAIVGGGYGQKYEPVKLNEGY
jgi:saccharopepsin